MRGIHPQGKDAAMHLGCARASITQIQRNGNTPRGEIVAGAARMLGVSADYLLGLTDIPDPFRSPLTPEQDQAVKLMACLNASGIEAVLSAARGIAASPEFSRTGESCG